MGNNKIIGYICVLSGLLVNNNATNWVNIVLIIFVLGTMYLEEYKKSHLYTISFPTIIITTILQGFSYIKKYSPGIGWEITSFHIDFPGYFCEDILIIIGCILLFISYRKKISTTEQRF